MTTNNKKSMVMDVGFFQKYQEEMDKIPKLVVPKEKAGYEYLLGEYKVQ